MSGSVLSAVSARAPGRLALCLSVAAACAVLLACPGAGLAPTRPACAHGALLDFDAIESRIEQKIADPTVTAKALKAYKALAKKLDAEPNGKLSDDARKVVAVADALEGPLSGDAALASLLEDAIDRLDAILAVRPDLLSVEIGKLRRPADRSSFETKALGTYEKWRDARSARGEPGDAAALYRKAAQGYEKVLSLTQKKVRKTGGPAVNRVAAVAGAVYTVIGTGEGGFNGNGREARRSSLYFVDECAFGPDGRLYILDWNNHRVRCLEADGTLSPLCGSGVPGDSEGEPDDTALNHPSALAFAPDGRVFLGAWHNHKVKVYDPRGTPSVYTIAGSTQGNAGNGGLATDAKMNLTPGILRLPDGDLLVCDAANQVIRKVFVGTEPQSATNVAGASVTTGRIERFAGQTGVAGRTGDGGQAIDATLSFSKAQNAEPDGRMARDAAGNVYIVSGTAHCIRKIASNGVITTFAGTGTAGYSGDGAQAAAAQLDGPSDVAVAADGTVYISDSNNHAIRRVAPDGTISTYAGGNGAGAPGTDGTMGAAAQFNRPAGLELDAEGNLYVCDRYNNVIRMIAATVTTAQVPTPPYSLPLPAGGVPPAKGGAGTIDTFAGSGVLGFNGNGRPALDTEFFWPQDVAVDPTYGLVHLVDWNNHRVRRIESDGTVTTIVGNGQLGDTQGLATEVRMNHPTDLTFHPVTGDLWIAGWHTDKILRLDQSTNSIVYMAGRGRTFSGDGGPANLAEMNIASSVKFDSAGNWYICDEGNRRLRSVSAMTNTIQTICGTGARDPLGDNGPAAAANLDLPVGQSAQPGGRVCLSPDDRFLYVADTNHHRVRRIDLQDPSRTITTIAGNGSAGFSGNGGPAVDAELNSPVDVDCDAAGNVYIVDRDNHAVRRVTIADGSIHPFAGDGDEGYTGDKAPATQAKLRTPGGISVVRSGAQAGRVYIADTYNGVVRVVWE